MVGYFSLIDVSEAIKHDKIWTNKYQRDSFFYITQKGRTTNNLLAYESSQTCSVLPRQKNPISEHELLNLQLCFMEKPDPQGQTSLYAEIRYTFHCVRKILIVRVW